MSPRNRAQFSRPFFKQLTWTGIFETGIRLREPVSTLALSSFGLMLLAAAGQAREHCRPGRA
jgi:hypothetical protein